MKINELKIEPVGKDIEIRIVSPRSEFPKIKRNFYEFKLQPDKEYTVEIKPERKKRSLNANAYMWALVRKIAQVKGFDEETVYRQEVSHGTAYYRLDLAGEAVPVFARTWEEKGIGWFIRLEGPAQDQYGLDIPGRYTYRAYYGSSVYDNKEMSDLIDLVVQDAQVLGIETMTPRELQEIKSMWKGER